ncbi:hypothetical protein RINTHH_1610 [Richelia intracellularis HH01]|uniref:Uncharacterized protein n=1 Tax=Richelia intracellularis HH01 TaxID=1165094 RepID=M1X4K7_9NOST|nr:hypothetical protein [Richelia intracellularis]CCH66316.1 hypothetical protein RINTHH_1610 [Richelia intracellularis HH01]
MQTIEEWGSSPNTIGICVGDVSNAIIGNIQRVYQLLFCKTNWF